MDSLYKMEGNKYLNPDIDEKFIVKRVENWGPMGPVAIMEYEDGTPYDEPAQWIKQNCELLQENAAPVDLTFYDDEGVESKARVMGGNFSTSMNNLPSDYKKLAKVFKRKVRQDKVQNKKGRTFSEELERFANANMNKQDVINEAWSGFVEYTGLSPNNTPDTREEMNKIDEIATN